MQIQRLPYPAAAADLQPEQIAGSSQLNEREKITAASRHFEAVLLRQILETTQKPLVKSKYTDNSTAAGIYRDMVTNQLADCISKSGTFGLAQTFAQQLNHPLTPHTPAGPAVSEPATAPTLPVAAPRPTHHE